jgi:hypothetical protein
MDFFPGLQTFQRVWHRLLLACLLPPLLFVNREGAYCRELVNPLPNMRGSAMQERFLDRHFVSEKDFCT